MCLRTEEINVAGKSYSQTAAWEKKILFLVFKILKMPLQNLKLKILTVDRIVSLGKAFHLEANVEDIEELVDEHVEDLTTENLLTVERAIESEWGQGKEEEDSN